MLYLDVPLVVSCVYDEVNVLVSDDFDGEKFADLQHDDEQVSQQEAPGPGNADEVPDGISRSRLFNKNRPLSNHDDEGCENEVFKCINKIQKIGSISFQIDRAVADNITFGETAVSSEFDRSYESLEWYIPVKFKSPISFFDQIGLSIRQELRYYEAEASNDVLHAGRDHSDNKLTIWINKDLSDDFNVSLSARFRQRKTNSSYDWVSDLKSFNQVQLWCKIRWRFSYDKY